MRIVSIQRPGAGWRCLAGGFAVVLAAGCAMLQPQDRPEPPIVIVRNFCGTHVKRVTLSEVREDPGDAYRYASVSPLPLGASQSAVRPGDPPPLPADLRVEWVDSAGKLHAREISLRLALAFATGAPDEALVFELRPGGRVVVDLEKVP